MLTIEVYLIPAFAEQNRMTFEFANIVVSFLAHSIIATFAAAWCSLSSYNCCYFDSDL